MRELDKKLEIYEELTFKWQKKINLISNNTIHDIKNRHINDSLQIADLLPNNNDIVFDLGSGAGFPALPIAIKNKYLDVYCIEADQKKCSFLKTVSRETDTNLYVVNSRIENFQINVIPDFITARALASLSKLFQYCEKWIVQNANLKLIFPKGENANLELEDLKQNWKFDLEKIQSKTNEDAKILIFTNIKKT